MARLPVRRFDTQYGLCSSCKNRRCYGLGKLKSVMGRAVKAYLKATKGIRIRRRTVTAVTAFALILQSLLAADLMAAITSGDASDYRTITICTGYGYKQITLDAENNPVTPPSNDLMADCPACFVASGYVLILPTVLNATYQTAQRLGRVTFDKRVWADDRPTHAHRSRAPPRT